MINYQIIDDLGFWPLIKKNFGKSTVLKSTSQDECFTFMLQIFL